MKIEIPKLLTKEQIGKDINIKVKERFPIYKIAEKLIENKNDSVMNS